MAITNYWITETLIPKVWTDKTYATLHEKTELAGTNCLLALSSNLTT